MMDCPKCDRGGPGRHPAHCTPSARFWRHVLKTETCWQWTGHVACNGYGKINSKYAHRVSWEMHRTTLPNVRAMVVDHLCRNRRCVNPDHLELVTQRENIHRGDLGVLRTACRCGHPYPENERRRPENGRRYCITCNRERDRNRRKSA